MRRDVETPGWVHIEGRFCPLGMVSSKNLAVHIAYDMGSKRYVRRENIGTIGLNV